MHRLASNLDTSCLLTTIRGKSNALDAKEHTRVGPEKPFDAPFRIIPNKQISTHFVYE